MKKVLSFVLVLAMILGSVSLAFAQSFPDTKDTDYDEAATVLTDLEIISGYADGTFKPGNSITRAEFAAMMIRALGFKVAGTTAVTQFSDVEPSYWASTYIKYASELGIIYGYGDGTFRPKNNITNDEAIAMLVRALGYKAQYLSGSFPTSHLNVALGLCILDGVPTGSSEATRGDVAQLVFNALGENTVNYDANGAIRMGQSMLQRHGADLYDADGPIVTGAGGAIVGGNAYAPGDPFVVTGLEPSNISLAEYLGAFVTAYADADGNIIGVAKVLSEFITGAIDDVTVATGTATPYAGLVANDKLGDYKLRSNYSVAAGGNFEFFQTFNNGDVDVVAGVPTPVANFTDNSTYTLAVKVDGNYVTKVYSSAVWTPQADNIVDAEALEAIKDDDSLLGCAFKLNTKDEIDTTSYAVVGVDKLEDIKAGNVVAVYNAGGLAANNVVRVEVGTKTVSGTISRINSALSQITIGGTVYKLTSADPAYANAIAVNALSTGDKGTFYLDYQGRIYDFEAEDTTHLYGIVLDENVGAPGLNGATPKVKLFTEEGKKVTYVCVDELANYTGAAPYAWAGGLAGLAADDIVDFTLNTSGQIKTMTRVAITDAAAAVSSITKSGTVDGLVFDSKSVIFSRTGAGTAANPYVYSVVQKADVLGKSTDVGGYQINSNANNVVKVAVLSGIAGAEAPSYAFVKWDYIDNADYAYEVFFLADDGSEAKFFSNFDDGAVAPAIPVATEAQGGATWANTATPALYDLTVNSTNGITSATRNVPGANDVAAWAPTGAATTTCKKQGDVYVLTDGVTDADGDGNVDAFTLASDVTVFVASSGKWAVKSVANLKGLDATNVVDLFDLSSTPDAVYDVVFVQ